MARIAIKKVYNHNLSGSFMVIYFYNFVNNLSIYEESGEEVCISLTPKIKGDESQTWRECSETDREAKRFLSEYTEYIYRSKNNKSISGLTRFKY